MKTHLAIRGFAEGVRQFEDLVELDPESQDLENLLPALAKKHATAMAEKHGEAMAAHELQMIEIEFLDEPDPEQRYFRFGSDPRHMVAPILAHFDLEAGD